MRRTVSAGAAAGQISDQRRDEWGGREREYCNRELDGAEHAGEFTYRYPETDGIAVQPEAAAASRGNHVLVIGFNVDHSDLRRPPALT
jgi:hypothetical protein